MIEKSYAKVNIFLKITGTKVYEGRVLHTFNSRFMVVENLYDTIEFKPKNCDSFTIEGVKGVDLKDNIIFKAYKVLNEYVGDLDILNFFYNHKVVVKKNIPFGAGLGGGSSNAATFMKMVHKVCNLKISIDELANLGAKVGADVPFFIYNYSSANVSGFGEIIENFNEEPLNLEIYTPQINSNTALVYSSFRDNFLKEATPNSGASLMLNNSYDILMKKIESESLNDLYKAALLIYPELKNYQKDGWFFSGSGSSFFRIKE